MPPWVDGHRMSCFEARQQIWLSGSARSIKSLSLSASRPIGNSNAVTVWSRCDCERFLGGVRRECLDHVIILGEDHLRSVLSKYVGGYFNTARPHQGIGQRISSGKRTITSDATGKIVAFPVLNGLHHDYRWAA
jgi:hypothetical protein